MNRIGKYWECESTRTWRGESSKARLEKGTPEEISLIFMLENMESY